MTASQPSAIMVEVDEADVFRWVALYEDAWRSSGTSALPPIFSSGVTYLPSPWADPVVGLDALGRFWEAERDGPDEAFSMEAEPVAVEGDIAVVRVQVEYVAPPSSWRNLWVIQFDGEQRCRRFEEWPFEPDQPDGH
jgi:hypothetical protein